MSPCIFPLRIFISAPATPDSRFDCLPRAQGQQGVGMQKQQDITLRDSRASVHLPRSTALSANYLRAGTRGYLLRAVLAPAVHYNHFATARAQRNEMIQQTRQLLGFIRSEEHTS